MQSVLMGENIVRHIPGVENPADFLTKWLPDAKFKASIEYMTNGRALEQAADAAWAKDGDTMRDAARAAKKAAKAARVAAAAEKAAAA